MASKQQLQQFLNDEFPQTKCTIESVGNGEAVVTHPIGFDELRPGGTVSGPTLMGVADVTIYVALLGEIGLRPEAVTTNLSISFLRKPAGSKEIEARCKMIKVGKTLAVGEVSLYSAGQAEPVAHVVGTYAIPNT